MSTAIKPVIDKDITRKKFEKLLEENGETTSLDVKRKLRDEGYWATQEKVTSFMREIAMEENIGFTFNGIYRTYYEFYNTPVKPNSALKNLMSNQNNIIDPVDINNPIQGDWEVWDVNGISDPCCYDGNLTAGQAKYQYSLRTGINFLDVRVKKIL